jgi:membrane protein implicated in regulation of membrane protease activity
MGSNDTPRRRPILESPWYWACLFCTAGLVALVLMGPKFAERQAQVERQYQGRERAAQRKAGETPSTPMSTAGDTRVLLWPLQLALAVILAVAWPVFWWHHFRLRSMQADQGSGLVPEETLSAEAKP